MPDITEWVKQIITVLILVGFLDLILPENELKGAAKLIMGLFIIILFIQPLGKILKVPDPASLPAISYFNQGISTDKVISQGLRMRGAWTKGLAAQNQRIIKDRISAALGMIENLRVDKIDVEFQDVQPTGVKVIASQCDASHCDAASRDLNNFKPNAGELSRRLTERIQNAVRLVTNLSATNVEVTWHAPN